MADEFDVTAENAIPETQEQAEALLSHWEKPSQEEETQAAAPEKEAETPQGFALKYKGKEETYPLEKILQFAQQGRDYSDKMRDLRVQREMYEAEKAKWAKQYPQDLTERLNRYKEVEDYIKANPAWWDHLNQSWQTRPQGQGQQAPLTQDPMIQNLVETVNGLQEKATVAEQREQALARAQEDEALDAQIREYREKYPDLDWGKVDETGHDLERRILDHAIKMGLGKPEHFKIAANDLLHDELMNRAKVSAKETVGKQIQKTTKLGLGPVTDKRTLPFKGPKEVSSKSWDDIAAMAIDALG